MNLPKCVGNYDVIVAGGGVSGVAAAVASARDNMKVLLVEKGIQLGGLATIGLINFFVPMCNGRGTQIIKGMAEEFLRLSIKHGYDTIPDEWKDGEPTNKDVKTRYVTNYSAPIFSLELTELLKNEGVDIMFDTVVTDAVMNEKHCEGLVVYNKSGFSYYKGKMIIDTTGDCDILNMAGIPLNKRGNFNTYLAYFSDLSTCEKVLSKKNFRYLSYQKGGATEDLYGHSHKPEKKLWDGTNGDDVSEYLIENQINLLNNIKDTNRKERDIIMLPSMPQFRTTRCIDGDYMLKENDEYKHFDDSICAICDFDRRDFLYEVSYRTLIKSGFDNLITAGRSASAEGYAWDVLRVIPPAILTGQAAGSAAAQAIKNKNEIYNIDILTLQNHLEKNEVMIHFDDALIPEDTSKVEKYDVGHI